MGAHRSSNNRRVRMRRRKRNELGRAKAAEQKASAPKHEAKKAAPRAKKKAE
jgi:hypothetical protein